MQKAEGGNTRAEFPRTIRSGIHQPSTLNYRLSTNHSQPSSINSLPLRLDFSGEPGAGVSPVALGGTFGNAEHLGGFLDRHADKISKLHQLSLLFVHCGQLLERVVHRQKLVIILHREVISLVQVNSMVASAAA